MKKSVYSLVLMDSVIKAVDERAYALGTNRSNLINQILAHQLSCVTPEMRMREIFNAVNELLGDSLQVQQQHSASLMTLRTALEYKYRPTINYKVELARSPDDYIGTLRVFIRTQSNALISLFNDFFLFFIEMEARILPKFGYNNYKYELSSGCFTRNLINSRDYGNASVGEAISAYIRFLDHSIKIYFSQPERLYVNSAQIEAEYILLLKETII